MRQALLCGKINTAAVPVHGGKPKSDVPALHRFQSFLASMFCIRAATSQFDLARRRQGWPPEKVTRSPPRTWRGLHNFEQLRRHSFFSLFFITFKFHTVRNYMELWFQPIALPVCFSDGLGRHPATGHIRTEKLGVHKLCQAFTCSERGTYILRTNVRMKGLPEVIMTYGMKSVW